MARIGDVRRDLSTVFNKYPALMDIVEPSVEMVDIPGNPDDLFDEELDRCLLSFGAWRGYYSALLANIEAELSMYENAYTIRLGQVMGRLDREMKRKVVKEILIGLSIEEDEELKDFQDKVSELKAERIILKGRYDYFHSQFETVSRVITRRGQERFKAVM